MDRPPFIILSRTEWERLRRQGGPPPAPAGLFNTEHLKEMIELSQKWIKTWPDTFEGHLAKLELERKQNKLQKTNAEFIRTFKEAANKAKQENTTIAMKEARQMIFEGTNYGRQLLSALLESRATDEQNAQVKFNKKVKQKALELAKEDMETKGAFDIHDKDADRKKEEKIKTLECIRFNKEIALLKKEKQLEDKLEKERCAIEAEKLMKQVIEIEKMEKEDIKRCEKEKLQEYEADSKKLAISKDHDEKLTGALIEAAKKTQDRIKVKSQAVLKKVHHGRPDTKWAKDLYKMVERMHIEENKRYEDFVDKGIKAYEQRNSKKEAMDKLQEKQKRSSVFLTSQMNKIAGIETDVAQKCGNKCACNRQSLIMNLNGKSKKQKANNQCSKNTDMEKKPKKRCNKTGDKLSFLAPRNNLTEALRRREKEPSPYNGTQGAHRQFAQQADDVLKEIKHKHFARKVVDEYRRLNYLDAGTLPVPNY